MMEESEVGSPERIALAQELLGIVFDSWKSQAIYVAAQLRIADLLIEEPRTAEELSVATNTDSPSLYRLLRALTTIEICREREDGAFELLPMGEFLRSETADSIRSTIIFSCGYQWPVWGNLLYSVQTGKSARQYLTGAEGFQHLERDPELAATFSQSMSEIARLVAPGIVQAYDFSKMKRVVDVGGAHGELLATILAANPALRGVLFDLPHAAEHARSHMANAGVVDRCEFVSGDFFKSVTPDADGYVLKSVVHDWNDERSQVILENCRRAMAPGAKLLLVERVVPGRLEASPAHHQIVRSDLNMLISLAAQERNEDEFRRLLDASGFRITRIIPVGFAYSIIEAIPTP
jgi:SAM-dependent methyltransferase